MSKEFDTSLDVLFGKVDELVSTKTVVGEAIVLGDVTLLPLIEVGVGVGLGAKIPAVPLAVWVPESHLPPCWQFRMAVYS